MHILVLTRETGEYVGHRELFICFTQKEIAEICSRRSRSKQTIADKCATDSLLRMRYHFWVHEIQLKIYHFRWKWLASLHGCGGDRAGTAAREQGNDRAHNRSNNWNNRINSRSHFRTHFRQRC